MSYLKFVLFLARTLPNKLPGKTRFIRLILGKREGDAGEHDIPGKHQLLYRVPNIRESVAFNLICSGIYEEATINAIVSLLPPGGTFVDGGANIGSISMPVARLRPDVTILSVEGDPDIADVLAHNVETNRIPNIRIVKALLGKEDNTIQTFYKAPDHKFGMGSLGNHFGSDGVSLKTRSIDGILAQHNLTAAVVKLDIEGAEVIALSGATAALNCEPAPAIIFEYQPWAEDAIDGQSAGDSQRLLRDHGFSLFKLDDKRNSVEGILTTGHGMLLARKP